jgi:SAM-dependent methyltransferase
MPDCSNVNEPGATCRLYWNARAAEYALPFEKENLSRTNRIIEIAESNGLSIWGARILDIGCGPGTFALPLAMRGASVKALDISDAMLTLLDEEMRRESIKGVESVRASWKDTNPVAAGFYRKFDIVLSAFSSAAETEIEIMKMEQCSRQWCVYAASGKTRHDRICKTLRRKFGLPLNPRPDIRDIRNILEKMGRTFRYESYPVIVQGNKPIADIADYVATSLEELGKTQDRTQILNAISSESGVSGPTDVLSCKRRSEIGVLLWQADQNG